MDYAGAAGKIPDLERLMRSVIRTVAAKTWGTNWLDDGISISKKARDKIASEAERARRSRPDEHLADDWQAAGLDEILTVLVSRWPDLSSQFAAVWPSDTHMRTDIERLKAYRGKGLHAVGAPPNPAEHQELEAMILRLRIAFEAVRRIGAPLPDQWWPYIERIDSNVDWSTKPTLYHGDVVTITVTAVNPRGGQEDLRYWIGQLGVANPRGLSSDPSAAIEVVEAKSLTVQVLVRHVDDEHGRNVAKHNLFGVALPPEAGPG